jgi:hypothetical protein
MMDLATALWNKRQAISQLENGWQLSMVLLILLTMDLGTYIQLYASCLEFAPDLIVELGRRYGDE